jgi:hypothetical protein
MAPSQNDIEDLQQRLEEVEKEKKEAVEAAERRARKAEEDKQKAEERAIRAEQERDQTNTIFQEYCISTTYTSSIPCPFNLTNTLYQGRCHLTRDQMLSQGVASLGRCQTF